jgi:hypothetical protein
MEGSAEKRKRQTHIFSSIGSALSLFHIVWTDPRPRAPPVSRLNPLLATTSPRP